MHERALFFDRDGTLIVHRPYLADPDGVELMPGVRKVLHQFISDGCLIFLFTNQSGVGRGLFTIDAVHHCNQRMLELLALPAPGFTEICIATETLEMPQLYRKPSPRFILEMIEKYSLAPQQTWMIGDAFNDVMAGLNAGVRAAMVHGVEKQKLPAGVLRCGDFEELYTSLPHEDADRRFLTQ